MLVEDDVAPWPGAIDELVACDEDYWRQLDKPVNAAIAQVLETRRPPPIA